MKPSGALRIRWSETVNLEPGQTATIGLCLEAHEVFALNVTCDTPVRIDMTAPNSGRPDYRGQCTDTAPARARATRHFTAEGRTDQPHGIVELHLHNPQAHNACCKVVATAHAESKTRKPAASASPSSRPKAAERDAAHSCR